MSQTAAGADDGGETPEDPEEPAIEADLFEEELRIDGICGVY